jgi:hypothetical protein
VPDRRFLTDTELDRIIDTLPGSTALPVGMLDQIGAATRDMAGMSYAMAATAAARGDRAFLGTEPDDRALWRRLVRPRLRMMLATFSAGVTSLCGHTQQIRPMLLSCDPPTLVCMQPACLAKVDQNAKTAGFRWDNHCDGCGHRTEKVFPYLTAFGPLSISGHLCQACADEMAEAAGRALAVQVVGRKSPCPCNSGRRFKHCHGRAA